jgi:hypothetical protein
MVPGWPYSIIAALETGRPSWTAVLDAVRLEPGGDVAAVPTVQIRELIERLVATELPPCPIPFCGQPGRRTSARGARSPGRCSRLPRPSSINDRRKRIMLVLPRRTICCRFYSSGSVSLRILTGSVIVIPRTDRTCHQSNRGEASQRQPGGHVPHMA